VRGCQIGGRCSWRWCCSCFCRRGCLSKYQVRTESSNLARCKQAASPFSYIPSSTWRSSPFFYWRLMFMSTSDDKLVNLLCFLIPFSSVFHFFSFSFLLVLVGIMFRFCINCAILEINSRFMLILLLQLTAMLIFT
jgi:hypothetical protein